MNCLANIVRQAKYAATPPPIPDLIWLKLNGDILDYRGDGVGKVGATTAAAPQYEVYNNFNITRQAYRCDGFNYINLPSLLPPVSMTFSCWINMSTFPAFARIFDYATRLRFRCTSNDMQLVVNDAYNIVYSSSFQNKWKHIAYTINGSTLIAFENGLPLATFTTTALKPTFTPTSGYICHSGSTFDPINSGSFSDFRIYSTVLTNTQIMGLFYNM